MRAVISTAVDGVIIIDEHGIVRLFNAACERLFGYSAEEVVGQDIKALIPNRYREERDGYIETCRNTGPARNMGIGWEVIGERKDGSQFPIGLSVGKAFHEDERFFVCIVRDLTEQKLTEKMLRKAVQEAESANRAKSDFLAVTSHEIRTPLLGIVATAGLLLHSDLTERQVQYAETIQRSGEALIEVVNNILDLSNIEAGDVVVKEARFEPSDLLDSVESLWQSRVRKKGLEYVTKVGHDVPPVVIGDADRIREILNNLVSNSVKFTEQGRIAVKVGVDAKAGTSLDGRVVLRFEVKDTGIGIDPNRQARLFESLAPAAPGLAICRQLTRSLGGEIGVVSDSGKVSKFWFTVSCYRAKQSSGRSRRPGRVMQKADDTMGQKPLTVLVAEDNQTNQVILRDILEYKGHTVDIAPNGREAVRAALRRQYDLILMDLRMPIMDGLQATQRIRAGSPGSPHVPIIALSADAMNGVRNQCLAAGMDDYISKPFKIAQIDEIFAKYGEAV